MSQEQLISSEQFNEMLRAKKEEDEILVELSKEEFIIKAQTAYDAFTAREKVITDAKQTLQSLTSVALNYNADPEMRVKFFQRIGDKALTIKVEPKGEAGFKRFRDERNISIHKED